VVLNHSIESIPLRSPESAAENASVLIPLFWRALSTMKCDKKIKI
jgi:hypothetical protein